MVGGCLPGSGTASSTPLPRGGGPCGGPMRYSVAGSSSVASSSGDAASSGAAVSAGATESSGAAVSAGATEPSGAASSRGGTASVLDAAGSGAAGSAADGDSGSGEARSGVAMLPGSGALPGTKEPSNAHELSRNTERDAVSLPGTAASPDAPASAPPVACASVPLPGMPVTGWTEAPLAPTSAAPG